jgi:Methyltransferase domain
LTGSRRRQPVLGLAKLAGRRVPPIRALLADRERLSAEVTGLQRRLDSEIAHLNERLAASEAARARESTGNVWPPLYPTGHFYSPVPDMADVRARDAQIFADADNFPGIDLRTDAQVDLASRLVPLSEGHPFGPTPAEGLRYYYDNDYFGWADGLLLLGMLRLLRPRRLVEVGSGFSSALILDVADRYLDGSPACTFIEPYPDRLRALLGPGDAGHARVLETRVQDAGRAVFDDLAAGDVLFIDSSHISKIGSDVNMLFLDVVPRLPAGVHVHVHDIIWPFEYARKWVYEGRAWNEAYLLQALLINNKRLRVTLWGSQLRHRRLAEMEALWPEWAAVGGTSLWLETTAPDSERP